MPPAPGPPFAPDRVTTARDSAEQVVAATERWLEKAVIGLGLCPFAERAHRRKVIRYRVSASFDRWAPQKSSAKSCSTCATRIRDSARRASRSTRGCSATSTTTSVSTKPTLPCSRSASSGELQIASFQLAIDLQARRADDVDDYTCSPYPMLHLLREASVARGGGVPRHDGNRRAKRGDAARPRARRLARVMERCRIVDGH